MSMEVTKLTNAERRPRHVAVGIFDGVHVGHREVIDDADTVLTFEPHPLHVIDPEPEPKLIMPFQIKRDAIEGLGVEELVVIPFDEAFSRIAPEEFCSGILASALGAERVSVAKDFRFAANAKGDAHLLASRREFSTRIVPLVEVDGEAVTSTRIRALIAAGEMEAAMRCLGAPFLLQGEVVVGDRRGRELGFPTANIVPADGLACPGRGGYAAFANGHPAAVNVGVRPTFETGRGLLVEAHLIDFEGDLYGRTLRLAFLARLSREQHFGRLEELITQMHRSVARARELCARFTPP